jgi:hypothetical protein
MERFCERNIHFEESESDLPTDIDINELHDDDDSDDRDCFTVKKVCLICGEHGSNDDL